MKRLNIELSEENHRKLKAACAATGDSITDVVTNLVMDWLDDNGSQLAAEHQQTLAERKRTIQYKP